MFGKNKYGNEASDQEIERDVAELRRLLDGVEGPPEPHPAYWQNFLFHVRERIDEDRFRQKRWSFSLTWSSLSAAALMVGLIVTGVIPTGLNRTGDELAGDVDTVPAAAAQPDDAGSSDALALGADILGEQTTGGLVLSSDDMEMMDAILSDDEDAIFEAMLDSENL